jgi:hypothetical protein
MALLINPYRFSSAYTPASETQGGTYVVGWYDFSDPTSMTKNSDGTGGNPANGETIGRIYNKADPSFVAGSTPSGAFLRNYNANVTYNSGGYADAVYSSGNQAAFQFTEDTGTNVRSMTASNSAGYTVAIVGRCADVSLYIEWMMLKDSASADAAYVRTFSSTTSVQSGVNSLNAGTSGTNNTNQLILGTLNKSGPEGKLYIDGTLTTTDSTGSTTADASGNGSQFNLLLNMNSTIRLYQAFITPRVLTDLTNLTAYMKAKGGIA